MKTRTEKILSVLLCAVMAFGAVLPVFASAQTGVLPTWQNTVETVTPVGDGPYVKIKLTPEGYKIDECRLPQQYDVVFKDGATTSVRISDEPSHFAPMAVYENFFDVETPEGTITLYARVTLSSGDAKETAFSVGQYILQGSLGDDGVPVAGSSVYEFPIFEETCESEIDEGNLIVRILYFFYSGFLKIQKWFVLHFGK